MATGNTHNQDLWSAYGYISRMRTFVLLVLILFTSASASAADLRMHLVHPEGSDLTLTELNRGNDLHAKFAGQVWVSGTVIGRWPGPDGATNMNYKEPDFVLVPDSESIVRLPYFFLREPRYFHRYEVRSIEMLNGASALRMAAGDEPVRKLLERRVNHVRISGRFLIEQYVVGVECDAPWARAVLVRVEQAEQTAKLRSSVPEGC